MRRRGDAKTLSHRSTEVRVAKAKPDSLGQTLGAACTQQVHSERPVYGGARGQETRLSRSQLTCSISALMEQPSSNVSSHMACL